MITTDIPIEEYCKIFDGPNVRCINLINEHLWPSKQQRIEKLKSIGTVRKIKINDTSDFEDLSSSKLPWYKDSSNKLVEWHDVDSINLTVKEAAERFGDNQMGNRIDKELVDNLKNGITDNICII
ncbi:MAG TPA: hypothetical protein VMW67_01250 [Desulfobacteria bacterium]|nr:hypothetical protein [Desulfobacteria bacterium]